MDIGNFVLNLHSLVRWLVILISLVTMLWFALTWVRRVHNETTDRVLMNTFTGLIDLQVLLGLILLIGDGIGSGTWPAYRIEHGVTMFIAAVVAHSSRMWRKKESRVRARNNFLTIVAVLVIVAFGISLLPYNAWTR
ncbi:MAG TPA: hypothetical protein VMT34_03760 [Aggregatilineales bacterium]|nr:hypothetical protein [Aggregatilineales bacterium]